MLLNLKEGNSCDQQKVTKITLKRNEAQCFIQNRDQAAVHIPQLHTLFQDIL